MGILNIPPELLLLITDNLSLGDLLTFRSSCFRVRDVLNPLFLKICLQDVGELTAIQWAAVRGYAKLIELAISNGAEIDAPLRGKLRMTGVNKANCLSAKNIKDIHFWANQSAETEAKDSIIRTPLFLAACFGHMKAIEVLSKLGANMQSFGEMDTPAHISAARGDVDCLRAFIRAGFDINTRGAGHRTILHRATYGGAEMIKYILQLEGGASLVNTRDIIGSTPLHRLTGCHTTNRQKRLSVELLLQHGADMHARNAHGDMPAHGFAWVGPVDCLRLLIDAGFDCHSRGAHGQTILHCAVHGRKKIMEYLLGQKGGKMIIDVGNDHRLTPLQCASEECRWDVVKVLMRHGASW